MSFHPIDQATARLNRSELAVPGSQPQMFEKAAQSDVDVIFLDLEDAVAPDEKEQARKNIIKGLNFLFYNLNFRLNFATHDFIEEHNSISRMNGSLIQMRLKCMMPFF